MKFSFLAVIVTLLLSACFMTEETYDGSSKYLGGLENTQVQVVTTNAFNLEGADSINRPDSLRGLDAQPSNAYMVNRSDLQTIVWTRFWMGDTIISKKVELDSNNSGVITYPLLSLPVDTLKPFLLLYLDEDYYDLSYVEDISFDSKVNLRLSWHVDQYDTSKGVKDDVLQQVNNALALDSAISDIILSAQTKSVDVVADYLVEEDTTFLDSFTLTDQGAELLVYDTLIVSRSKLRIDLSDLEAWDQMRTQVDGNNKFQFLNIGVAMLDDHDITPITFENSNDFDYRPRIVMRWVADSTLQYTDSTGAEFKTVEQDISESLTISRHARNLKFQAIPQREGRLKLFSDIGDTLNLSIAWDEITDAMQSNVVENGLRDDQAIVWAKLKIPIPAGAFESTYDMGARLRALTQITQIDNTPDFLNLYEHQFEDSTFTPGAILWESNDEDTLSLYITRLASRVVNKDLSGDSLRVAVSFWYAYSDSTSNLTSNSEYASNYRTFDKLDLGLSSDLKIQVEVGYIDLEGGLNE